MAVVVDVLIQVSKRVVFVLSWSLLIFVRQSLLVLVESTNVFLHHLPADRQFGVKGRRHRDLNECPIRESPLRARARLEYESRREKASMSAHASLGVNRFHFDGQGTGLDMFCPECNDLFPDVFRHMMDVHDCLDKLDCLVILYRHEKQYMNKVYECCLEIDQQHGDVLEFTDDGKIKVSLNVHESLNTPHSEVCERNCFVRLGPLPKTQQSGGCSCLACIEFRRQFSNCPCRKCLMRRS